ncbi:MAG TPA: enoyl-[acyl-carrier-protein] reductase FabI [Gammaproteobacteria bacterium]|nr:enoyl-[acyl-carrier-protein] reductase FabI [Gammaproteobacteria bacterium]|tara:strand:+ start:907 stop:1680 length:774 start_codon:yes stop_codon:yes gene_type:complete
MLPLEGKKGLIIGIANDQSIAYGCAHVCREQGADLAITYLNDRAKVFVQPLADELGVNDSLLLPFDVTQEGELEALFERITQEWGELDFVLHAMASATKAMTMSRLVEVELEDFNFAMQVSCHSFLSVARLSEPLLKKTQGSLITMTYLGGQRVMSNYHFMGPMKAALECCVRYVADEFGEDNIRVHAISASAMETRAASGIQDLTGLLKSTKEKAPLQKLSTPTDVGQLMAFLASPNSQGMTGGIHYVDGGYHIVG